MVSSSGVNSLTMTDPSLGNTTYEQRWNRGYFEVTNGPNSVQILPTIDANGKKTAKIISTTSVYSVWDHLFFTPPVSQFSGNEIHPQKQWGQIFRANAEMDERGCIESLEFDTEWGFEPGRLFFEAYNKDVTGMVRAKGSPLLTSTLPGGPHEVRLWDGLDAQLGGFA
jgi:hypothetical protein